MVQTHRCACGGILLDSHGGSFGVDGPVVRCLKDLEHSTIKAKDTRTRKLFNRQTGEWEAYDVITQKPVNQSLDRVLPCTSDGMLQRVDEVRALAPMWAKDMTEGQRRALAVTALAYGLDPLMEELILYQGKPMITIRGRRRKDAEAGHHPDIRFRFLSQEEKEGFTDAGALFPGDLVQVCVLTTEWGNTVEGIGTISKAQRDSHRQPVVNTNPLEMVQKRAEDRARTMAYGPVPRPQLPPGLEIIEGEGRLLEDPPLPAPTSRARPTLREARTGPAAQAPAQTPAQPAATPPGQRGTPPAASCKGHDNAPMVKSRRTGKVAHVLPDKTVCFGIPAAREDRDSSMPSPDEGADDIPDDDLPPSQVQDLDGLKAMVAEAGMEWEQFELVVLKMSWATHVSRGMTVEHARNKLATYLLNRGVKG